MGIYLGSTPVQVYFNGTAAQVAGVYLGAVQVYPTGAATTPASLLLNFNGDNDSTTFTDSSANGLTVTANGAAKLSTAVKKYGSASLLLDGSSSASVANDNVNAFGDDDFTIELWVYPTQDEPMTLAAKWNTSGAQSWFLGAGDNGYGFYAGSLGLILPFQEWPAINEWIHVAVTRRGADLDLWVNGQRQGSTYDIEDYAIPSSEGVALTIGDDTGANPGFIGYIDDFRIVKGKAVYTANFTPPAAELGPNA